MTQWQKTDRHGGENSMRNRKDKHLQIPRRTENQLVRITEEAKKLYKRDVRQWEIMTTAFNYFASTYDKLNDEEKKQILFDYYL